MIFGLVGSIAKSEQPLTDKLSVLVVQVAPPFVDFHNPPAGAPTHITLVLVGEMVIKFNLPDFKNWPFPVPLMAPIGPIAVQVVDAIMLEDELDFAPVFE
jgi:hypothetical protein